MQNALCWDRPITGDPFIKTAVRVMKITAFIMLVAGLQVSARSVSQTVTLFVKNATIKEVFQQVIIQTGVSIVYDNSLLETNKRVTVRANNSPVGQVLDLCLAGQDLTYKISNNSIIIKGPDKPATTTRNDALITPPVIIRGRITNENGEPLSGISVYIKGKPSSGTISDANGNYTITIPDNTESLVFSSVNMETLTLPVKGKSELNVMLSQKTSAQQEIVVVGYGTTKKRDLTGSVSSISHDQMNLGGVTSNVAQALQGKAAGVQVNQSNAAPGGQTIIRIRGGNSIKSTNEPLYVIDGFPSETGVDINPNDIEDIQVLKDASATAIYGARGANGVVMITTKRGKAGKDIIQYEGYYGISKLNKRPELMNGQEYMAQANAKAGEQGNPPEYSADELAANINTNWYDLTTRTGNVQSHDINFRGGGDNTRVAISGNYFDQEGLLKNTDFNRYSGRLNFDHDMNKHFKVGGNMYVSRSFSRFKHYDGNITPSNVMFGILNTSPAILPYNADGSFGTRKGKDNPLAWLLAPTDHQYLNKTSANAYAEYEILNGLSLRINGGTEQLATKIGTYLPTTLINGSKVNGQASVRDLLATRNLIEAYATYRKTISGIHSINIVAGFSSQKDIVDDHYTLVQNFTTDEYLYYKLDGAAERIAASSVKTEAKIFSVYGRVNYSYKDKYLATVTVRRDGSSNFGPNFSYGVFPSGSLAWRLSDEEFIRNLNTFSTLKVRASYGITGNDRIAPYSYLASFAPTNLTLDGQNSYGATTAERAANPNLKWESTRQFDLGIDMGFAGNRITATLDLYRKKTDNLLLDIPIGQWWGFAVQTVNTGAIENKGAELSINTENIRTTNFRWNTSLNLAYNKQKCLDLGGLPNIISKTANPDQSVGPADFTKLEAGQELSTIYGYVYAGVIQAGEKYDPQPLSVAGDPKFVDVNGDGEINAKDETYLGNTNPHYLAAISNDFSFKGIELNIFFQGAFDYNLYNMNALVLESNAGKDVLNRWTPSNTNTQIPRNGYLTTQYGGYVNSRFVQNASYLRCKMIMLGYNIPVPKKVFENLKVYASFQNAFTITGYKGTDPEVNSNGAVSSSTNVGPTNNLASGLDFNAFPAARTLTFGIKANF